MLTLLSAPLSRRLAQHLIAEYEATHRRMKAAGGKLNKEFKEWMEAEGGKAEKVAKPAASKQAPAKPPKRAPAKPAAAQPAASGRSARGAAVAARSRMEGLKGVEEDGSDYESVSDEDGATIQMATTLPKIVEPEIAEPTTWAVEYHVPFALFAKYFGSQTPTPGCEWLGNFYKCGDQTSHPHWGSWAPVDTPRPNFHQPNFYQPLIFA